MFAPRPALCAVALTLPWLLGASPAAAQGDAPAAGCQRLSDCTPRTALLSAFGAEADAYLAAVEGAEETVVGGIRFTTGRLRGHDVVVALTNVSMPNAVMVTQLTLSHFNVERLVMSGIAGGVNPDLHIGDVAVPARWALYQEMVYARETEDGFAVPPFLEDDLATDAAGEPLAPFGMMFPMTVELATAEDPQFPATSGTAGATTLRRLWIEADPNLLAAAEALTGEVALTDCLEGSEGQVCVSDGAPRPPTLIVGGSGVSGSTFVDNADFRKWVFEAFADAGGVQNEPVHVLDMESAGAAFVAEANGVPFLAVRTVSDLAGGELSLNVLPIFGGLAIANSSAVVLPLLDKLADG